MSRTGLRALLLVSLLGFLIARVVHVLRGGEPTEAPRLSPTRLSPTRASTPVAPVVAEPAITVPTWCDPVDGACPDGYVVKAKLNSGIFHLPGMSAYARTTPDRCYVSPEAALADGLRAAKR